MNKQNSKQNNTSNEIARKYLTAFGSVKVFSPKGVSNRLIPAVFKAGCSNKERFFMNHFVPLLLGGYSNLVVDTFFDGSAHFATVPVGSIMHAEELERSFWASQIVNFESSYREFLRLNAHIYSLQQMRHFFNFSRSNFYNNMSSPILANLSFIGLSKLMNLNVSPRKSFNEGSVLLNLLFLAVINELDNAKEQQLGQILLNMEQNKGDVWFTSPIFSKVQFDVEKNLKFHSNLIRTVGWWEELQNKKPSVYFVLFGANGYSLSFANRISKVKNIKLLMRKAQGIHLVERSLFENHRWKYF